MKQSGRRIAAVVLALGLNISGGRVVCKPVADAWGLPYEPLAL